MPADGLAPAPGDAWSRRLYDGGPPPTTTRHSQYNNNLGGEPRGPREQVVTAQSVEKSQLLGRQKSPENAQDAREVSVLETWYMEIVSSILALSCIAAIVIILSLYQGKPLPAWPKLISVNALIAVFTAIFKASLIMPVAEGCCLFHIDPTIPDFEFVLTIIFVCRNRTAKVDLVRPPSEAV